MYKLFRHKLYRGHKLYRTWIGKKFLEEFNKNMVAFHEQVEMYGGSGDKAVKNVHFGLFMEQQYHSWDLTNWYDSSEASC